jgi:catechol 2,3-dioxygenase-like lactoylglutathione lyase family enzyme
MGTEIIHANIVVRDVEKSVKFYTELLGARVVRDWWGESEGIGESFGFDRTARWHCYMLRWGEGDDNTFPQIDLLQWLDPPAVGEPYPVINHLGIARIALMVDDIDGMYQRLVGAGATLLSEPKPFSPHTERGRRLRFVTVKDPDGIFIELVGRSEGTS